MATTSWPKSAKRAIVPPQPDSGSSGWPPTMTAFSGFAPSFTSATPASGSPSTDALAAAKPPMTFRRVIELRAAMIGILDFHRLHQFLHVIHAALEHAAFGVVHFDFEHLFDAVFAEDAGDADEIAADAVFFFAVGGAGEDAFFVADDGFGHGHGGAGGGVVGAAGFQQRDDC